MTVTGILLIFIFFLYNNLFIFKLFVVPISNDYNTPRCSFDKDIVGNWFIKRNRITIDDKMHFPPALNQMDFYLSCQQTNGTRYLLSETVLGKW